MADKFKDIYRIQSCRMQGWDYSSNGGYFITICTYNREQYFGQIFKKKMILSDIGVIANNCWQEIPQHFPFVILDKFVVMPNHIHGILVIDHTDDARDNARRDMPRHVSTMPIPIPMPSNTPPVNTTNSANR
jgi:REP element-mobilizing transposase RayT